ncbi:CinA family protein [Aquabacterium sp. OR-4]|uniref:CinA family protein n=1 Tax=Aquabacterium sp. OR-4 TaxID=2978127 RepID=UPI0021B1675F|nr:CinA family protein [Aquabacterium sp. OR-4]MDT7833880.1 CinA family protein [Aquabacterium sp. OR-4]
MSPAIDTLVATLAATLRARGLQMASAESCTGGLIAAACTDLAGSSDWFERGVVSYSNAAKTALLGVPAELIHHHGAVSEPVARAMAAGLLAQAPVALAVAVTGVAGPGGGTASKPVGLVWLAWAWRDAAGAAQVQAVAERFAGDRTAVRAATVARALQGLLAQAPLAVQPAPAQPAAGS